MNRFLIGITITFFASCLLLRASPVHAQLPGVEGWYCVGTQPGTIWHQIPSGDPNVADTQIKQEDCGADEQCTQIPPPNDTYFGDVECAKTHQPTQKGPGTTMYTTTGTLTQGDLVQIGITSNKDSGPDCHLAVAADAIKVFGRLESCQVLTATECGCTTKHIKTCDNKGNCNCDNTQVCGPSDWHINTIDACGEKTGFNPYDNRQCTTNFTCKTNALGTYDIPFRPADTSCWNDSSINVVAPTGQGPIPLPTQDCQKSTQAIPAPVNDKNILADSLQDDYANVTNLKTFLLPDGVTSDLTQTCNTKDPLTGVERSFLTNFACIFKDLPVLGGLLANLCPKEVNFFNQQTTCLTQTSLAVENRTRPDSFNPPAQVQACEIIDFGQPSTSGNKDISTISNQLGGPQGTYTQDVPVEIPVNTDQTQNLYTEGKVIDSDKRVPDINQRCKIYSNANFAPGISRCSDNSLVVQPPGTPPQL